MKALLIACALLVSGNAIAADTGAFKCLELSLEQIEWFKTGQPKRCCDIGDGKPTVYEQREDGYYIPPHGSLGPCDDRDSASSQQIDRLEDKRYWVRVLDANIKRVSNPIGFAIVWWANDGTNRGGGDDVRPVPIRCVVLLNES